MPLIITVVVTLDQVVEATDGAYSRGLYYSEREWRRIAKWLMETYTPAATAEILRSKWMRWASDSTDKDPVHMTLEKFKAFYSKRTPYDSVRKGIEQMFQQEMPDIRVYRSG